MYILTILIYSSTIGPDHDRDRDLATLADSGTLHPLQAEAGAAAAVGEDTPKVGYIPPRERGRGVSEGLLDQHHTPAAGEGNILPIAGGMEGVMAQGTDQGDILLILADNRPDDEGWVWAHTVLANTPEQLVAEVVGGVHRRLLPDRDWP